MRTKAFTGGKINLWRQHLLKEGRHASLCMSACVRVCRVLCGRAYACVLTRVCLCTICSGPLEKDVEKLQKEKEVFILLSAFMDCTGCYLVELIPGRLVCVN